VILAVDVPQSGIETLIAEGAAVIHSGHADAFPGEPAAHHVDDRLDRAALIDAVYAYGGIDIVIGNAAMAEDAAFLERILSQATVKP
jgi:NAD(P)-dependent dehydrogenase (short-subunit alcohol dehydrogenase family)